MLQVKSIIPGRPMPQVALGTIHLGRPWPMKVLGGQFDRWNFDFPTFREAEKFVVTAYEAGVRMIDTAHAYGLSEMMLGRIFKAHPEIPRDSLIATKGGETFDLAADKSIFDNSLEGLTANIRQSQGLLGRVDIWYFHAPHIGDGDALRSAEIKAGLTGLVTAGELQHIGISVENFDLMKTLHDEGHLWPTFIQVPASFVNRGDARFDFIDGLRKNEGKIITVNRPWQERQPEWDARRAHRFFRETEFMVITGTRNHLDDNLSYFEE